jgi:hypothetical protein
LKDAIPDLEDHWTPGCPDHPYIASDLFGVSSLSPSHPQCDDKNALSGVPYNVFHGQPGNVYDKFCFNLDTTANLKWTVDAHGEQYHEQGKGISKRTPPPDPNAYSKFNFELNWETNQANRGCGQNIESCRDAFAKIADSPCGHQGGK